MYKECVNTLLYRPPTPTRQTLAVTLYVLYFTVRKGSSATVCLHFVAYCCFLFSKETSPYEKKQAITILASIETYENLVSFQNVKELNDTVRAYKEQFADRLNKINWLYSITYTPILVNILAFLLNPKEDC